MTRLDRYTILKNKSVTIPQGAAPCCPKSAVGNNITSHSPQSPPATSFVDLLGRENPGDTSFQDFGAFDHSSPKSYGLYSEPDLFPHATSFSPYADLSKKTEGFVHEDGNTRLMTRRETLGSKDDESSPESAGDKLRNWTDEERQQIMAANGLTSDEVESQLATFLDPDHDSMRIDFQSDSGPIDSSSSSSRGVHSRRTTITMDDVAPETLTSVMQILINAKAKVRFETE